MPGSLSLPASWSRSKLRHDMRPLPPYVEAAAKLGQRVVAANVWLGHGATTPLHWDASSNWLVQICGQKHIRLYSPKESPRLYAFTDPPNASQIVCVDPLKELDPEERESYDAKWPGFTDAAYQIVTLAPGDAQRSSPRLGGTARRLRQTC